eukprot:scaffold79214_cov71-Phaeocystis_antarctica.AAC.2
MAARIATEQQQASALASDGQPAPAWPEAVGSATLTQAGGRLERWVAAVGCCGPGHFGHAARTAPHRGSPSSRAAGARCPSSRGAAAAARGGRRCAAGAGTGARRAWLGLGLGCPKGLWSVTRGQPCLPQEAGVSSCGARKTALSACWRAGYTQDCPATATRCRCHREGTADGRRRGGSCRPRPPRASTAAARPGTARTPRTPAPPPRRRRQLPYLARVGVGVRVLVGVRARVRLTLGSGSARQRLLHGDHQLGVGVAAEACPRVAAEAHLCLDDLLAKRLRVHWHHLAAAGSRGSSSCRNLLPSFVFHSFHTLHTPPRKLLLLPVLAPSGRGFRGGPAPPRAGRHAPAKATSKARASSGE